MLVHMAFAQCFGPERKSRRTLHLKSKKLHLGTKWMQCLSEHISDLTD